jgi:DNA-binding CsgD family transcriptional regulator
LQAFLLFTSLERGMTVLTRHPADTGTGVRRDDAQHACIHELLRQLVDRIISARDTVVHPESETACEEIIVDATIDGVRYLIIRMPASNPALVSLSPREQEIARMVAKGYPNKTIAGVLNISSWTVCTHIRRIFAKLGVASRAAMVARLLEEGRSWEQQLGSKSHACSTADPSTTFRPGVVDSSNRDSLESILSRQLEK